MSISECTNLSRFQYNTVKFLREIKNSPEISVFKYQLTKSSSSSGANYEEAQATSSKADFKNKVGISLREMRESNYWFRIFQELEIGDKTKYEYLVKESDELYCERDKLVHFSGPVL